VEWQIPTSDLVEIDNLRARIWLALGDENHLQSWISENDPDERVDYATETIRLTLARVWIRRKQPARALAILEKVVQNSVAAGRQLAWFEAKILQAEAFQAGGDPARGQTALGEAIAAAQGEQIRRLFLDEGPQLLPLLRAAARDHPFAAAILDRFPPESLPDKLFTPRYQKQEQVLALKNVLVEPLTLRELEIAHLVAAGLSNPEIASRLCVSINTVKAHLKRIFAKLEAANRAQAIVRCRQLGIG
jgi:LuxR family maltose regulon positive regulatory protein